MITEDYVSYEIAKLLKEKGFDIPVRFEYHCIFNLNQKPQFHKKLHNFNGIEYSGLTSKWYSAPTHQMTLKWIREIHNIFIEIIITISHNGVYHYWYSILDKECKYIERFIGYYSSHELCVEAALLYVLKNLI